MRSTPDLEEFPTVDVCTGLSSPCNPLGGPITSIVTIYICILLGPFGVPNLETKLVPLK